MKKQIFRTVPAAVLAASLAFPVFAEYQVGDTVDYVLYTDIKTYINDRMIDSYNINNYTAVIAEELADYGFIVIWDDESRSLSIALGSEPEMSASSEEEQEEDTAEFEIGEPIMPVYFTDITVSAGEDMIPSFNIGGRTIVYMDDLAERFSDTYVYDDETRTLSMTVSFAADENVETAPEGSDPEPVPATEVTPEETVYVTCIPEKTALFKNYIKENGELSEGKYELACDMPSLGAAKKLVFIYDSQLDNIEAYLNSKNGDTEEYIETRIYLEGAGNSRGFSYSINESIGVRDDYSFSGSLVTMNGTGDLDVLNKSPILAIKDANGSSVPSRAIQVEVGKAVFASLVYTQKALDYYELDCDLTDFGFMEYKNYIIYA